MINLGTLGMAAFCTGMFIFIIGIAFIIYSFKTAILVDDYDNPIEESIDATA